MDYVAMTLEEAKKVVKKDAIVLVSRQYLEQEDCNIGFTKKNSVNVQNCYRKQRQLQRFVMILLHS